ncbi:hypothetical protein ACD591_04260 [Rufibacter glacialis]|uniref:DUF1735 domain-containing protein n=1 Tax=Rufibacter glacialis TaxID=1259555 RepID=A0A5M8QJS0_9BACT|nr:hypothetical protein [Rufibacter glacialis]KAA6434572.1 hypothetical protein FOE74_10325 [Rufibacter glacialis]GGK70747.1 hypothetical protein GCM10011405_18560 [Rufibacter glacialis]
MKKIAFYLCGLALSGLSLTACYDEPDFIADNTTPTGVGSAPVSANELFDLATNTAISTANNANTRQYAPGTEIRYELQFFSESPVKEINVYQTVGAGARTKVKTYPYAPAFSKVDRTDTLVVSYTVPQAPPETNVRIETEVLNQNNLNVIRTLWIRIRP